MCAHAAMCVEGFTSIERFFGASNNFANNFEESNNNAKDYNVTSPNERAHAAMCVEGFQNNFANNFGE